VETQMKAIYSFYNSA